MNKLQETNKKRISLYFNLNNEEEEALWNFISKKKKNAYLKRLIYNDMMKYESPAISVENANTDDDLSDVDLDNDGIEFDED